MLSEATGLGAEGTGVFPGLLSSTPHPASPHGGQSALPLAACSNLTPHPLPGQSNAS